MFYYIEGALAAHMGNFAVLDVGGVGYKLTVSATTSAKCAGKQKVRLYTYMAVREDAVELFGFFDLEELSVYKLLISVSGVGPKAAMSVLSTLAPEKLAYAVASGDAKAISKAPGVGLKTAARIILELKDKLSKEVSSSDGDYTVPDGSNVSDAQKALLVLGYSKSDAAKALSSFNTAGLELEDIIKEALNRLMK